MDIGNNQGNNIPQTQAQNIDNELFEDGVTYKDIIQKDILELMGFTTLDEERKNALHAKIERGIEDRVGARIYDALSEEDRDEYKKLLDAQNWDEAGKFLTAHNIDPSKWLGEEALIMKFELYEDSRYIKKKAAEALKKQDDTKKTDE